MVVVDPFPNPLPGPGQPGGGFDPTLPSIPLNPSTDTPAPNTITPAPSTTPSAPSTSSTGGVGPMADWKQFLIWLGALVVLWFILQALADAGFGREAYAFAGLISFGALLFLGPTAIKNMQNLITQ